MKNHHSNVSRFNLFALFCAALTLSNSSRRGVVVQAQEQRSFQTQYCRCERDTEHFYADGSSGSSHYSSWLFPRDENNFIIVGDVTILPTSDNVCSGQQSTTTANIKSATVSSSSTTTTGAKPSGDLFSRRLEKRREPKGLSSDQTQQEDTLPVALFTTRQKDEGPEGRQLKKTVRGRWVTMMSSKKKYDVKYRRWRYRQDPAHPPPKPQPAKGLPLQIWPRFPAPSVPGGKSPTASPLQDVDGSNTGTIPMDGTFPCSDIGFATNSPTSPPSISSVTEGPTPALQPESTNSPTSVPTRAPTRSPTRVPTSTPTRAPVTAAPVPLGETTIPTGEPTSIPTGVPSVVPSTVPTAVRTGSPTASENASGFPSVVPTVATAAPSNAPTVSSMPTTAQGETVAPSTSEPTISTQPSIVAASAEPTVSTPPTIAEGSSEPTVSTQPPTLLSGSSQPTISAQPSQATVESAVPTVSTQPSVAAGSPGPTISDAAETAEPTAPPSSEPTGPVASDVPSVSPTSAPSEGESTSEPTDTSSNPPSSWPSAWPSSLPSSFPSPTTETTPVIVPVGDSVQVAFTVLPELFAVQVAMTLQQSEGWMAFGPSPDGGMVGATACIHQGDVNVTPQLYDIAAKSSAGITLSTTQNLIEASIEASGAESVLTCTVPLDLADGFAWSSTTPTTFVVAWGDDNNFGYHGINRGTNLSVSPDLFFQN